MQTTAKELTGIKAIKPAILHGINGKDDDGYNKFSHLGAEKFKKKFGINYDEFDCMMNDAERERIVRTLARDGYNPIISPVFEWEGAIKKVAKDYPNTKFSIFHAIINEPNVQSIYWDVQYVDFLAGMVAGIKTKKNKIGTIIASDTPIIQTYACGFRQGAKYVNQKVSFINNIVSPTLDGFSNPTRGSEIARSQIDSGADVVYSLSGNTDYGVIKAIDRSDVMGVFSAYNRNHLSTHILLSAVIDPGVVVYNILNSFVENTWKPGVIHIGLKDKAQYLNFNRHLVTKNDEELLNKAREEILNDKLKVDDYRVNNNCPVR